MRMKWHTTCVCLQIVSGNREKISAEEFQCKAMAETAQRDLDKALPALEEAMKVDLCLTERGELFKMSPHPFIVFSCLSGSGVLE